MQNDESFQESLKNEEIRERMMLTLRIVPLFLKFTIGEIEEVLSLTRRVKYEPMEILFEQGSKDRQLHVILEGTVLLYARGADGQEQIIGQRNTDSCFGEIAFITGEPRNTSAKSGPKGSHHLVVSSEDFQQLSARHPELLFKVLSTIIDGVNERLLDLPSNFRNYVVWGLKWAGMGADEIQMDWSLLLIGAAIGAAVGGGLGIAASRWLPQAYPVLKDVTFAPTVSIWGGTILLAILGLFVGWIVGIQSMKRARGGIGPRCCMNCAHVVWDRTDEKFDCAYTALEMKGKVVKKGKEYDSVTDCPTFQYRDIARLS